MIKVASTIQHILYLLLFILPVTQSLPFWSVGGRTVSIGTDTFLLAIIYLVWIVAGRRELPSHHRTYRSCSGAVVPMLLWYLFTFAITVVQPRAAGQILDSGLILLRWFQYVPLFFILPNLRFSASDVSALVKTITGSALLVSVANIIEYNVYGVDLSKARGATWTTKSIFIETAGDNYNISGGYLMVAILLNIARFTHKPEPRRGVGLLILGILLLGLLYNTSRSSQIGVAVGAIFLIVSSEARQSSKLALIASTLSVVAIVYLVQGDLFDGMRKLSSVVIATPLLFGDTLSPIEMPEHVGSSFLRFSMWHETFKQIGESWLIGGGFASLRWRFGGDPMFTADSFYLELIADAGIVGFGAFWWMASACYPSMQPKQSSSQADAYALQNYIVGAQAAFWALLFINLTGNMFSSQTIWGIFVVLCCTSNSAVRTTLISHFGARPTRRLQFAAMKPRRVNS